MKYGPEDLVDASGAAELIGVFSKAQVYKLLETEKSFPKLVIDFGEGRARLWYKKDLLSWLKTTDVKFVKTYVYFAESSKHLKIGISRNPIARINDIKNDIYNALDDVESRKSLRLIGYFPGSLTTERTIQKLFAQYQVQTTDRRYKTPTVCKEWFYDKPEIRRHMNKLIKAKTLDRN